MDIFNFFLSIFKDRFYIGVSQIDNIHEKYCNNKIFKMAYCLFIPVVAINDVCFLNREDFEAHEVKVCINRGKYLSEHKLFSEYTDQQFLKSYDQMNELFFNIPECMENTVEVSIRCNYMFDLDTMYLPCYFIFDRLSVNNYLYKISKMGLECKLELLRREFFFTIVKENEYVVRLEYELKIIKDMNFSGYFLIVADFINWSKSNNIPVGPGRGSGAGSLIAYVLSITNVDPIKYDLLFERFLNPMRLSMPDFDIDFCIDGRDNIIDYVFSVYGYNSVSQIIVFGTMATKAAIRDVGRVLGFRYGISENIYKLLFNCDDKSLKFKPFRF